MRDAVRVLKPMVLIEYGGPPCLSRRDFVSPIKKRGPAEAEPVQKPKLHSIARIFPRIRFVQSNDGISTYLIWDFGRPITFNSLSDLGELTDDVLQFPI